jgi:serine/threonine protein kinase
VQEIALQLFDAIVEMHTIAKYIHRDIKPPNIRVKDGKVYLIDFGTIRNYLDVNGQHFTDQYAHYSFVGTAKFASLNAHDLKALTRRDDLECLGYTLLALLTNYSLGLFMIDESKLRTDRELHQYFVKEKRELTCIKDHGGVADSLTKIRFFISLCRQIGFQEEPEYQKLRFILEVLN